MQNFMLMLCALGLCAFLHAEEPFLGWKQTRTDHFLFIYEEKDKAAVDELVTFAEDVYDSVTSFLDSKPDLVPCIVFSRIDTANGSFTYPPAHLELYVTAPSTPWNGARNENWLRSLLTHELTHFVHISYEKGFFSDLAKLFGEGVKPGTAVFMLGWMIEGITTNTESLFTEGGRGRNPFFEMLYKARILEGNFFSFPQAGYTSVFPPNGRQYVAGYVFVSYLLERFGYDSFRRIHGEYVKNPFLGPLHAIKTVTGENAEKLWADMQETLEAKYEPYKRIVGGKLLSPDDIGDYYLPVITEAGLYLYRRTLHEAPAIVRFDPAEGKENILLSVTLTDHSSFSASADGSLIAFSSFRSDGGHESGETLTADLSLYDVGTGKLKRLTQAAHLWQPALSGDGKHLVAVQGIGPYSRLVTVDLETGALGVLYAYPSANVYNPCFSPDGKKIAFALNVRGMQDICVMDYLVPIRPTSPNLEAHNTEAAMRIIGPDFPGDYFPVFVSNCEIMFSSDRSGSLALYKADLDTNRITPAAEDPVAAWAGTEHGGTLIYASYTSKGYCIKEKPTISEKPMEEIRRTQEPLPQPFVWNSSYPSQDYTDWPLPLLWLPYPALKFHSNGTIALGMGAYHTGYSYLGTSSYSFSLSLFPETGQTDASGSLYFRLGRLGITYEVGQTYDIAAKDYHTQTTTQTLQMNFPVLSTVFERNILGLSVSAGMTHSFALVDEASFTFPESFGLASPLMYNTLYPFSSFSFSFRKSASSYDIYSPFGVSLAAVLSVPLRFEAIPVSGFIVRANTSFFFPSLFRHQVMKLGLKSSWISESMFGLADIAARGMFTANPQITPGSLLFSLDYLFTIAMLDTPLPFGFYLLGMGGGLHAEKKAHVSGTGVSFDDYLYTGVELTIIAGYAGVLSFPLGFGLSVRFDPGFVRQFKPFEDIRPYFFIGTDSFSSSSGTRPFMP